ncbi:MAG: hypothetical protein PHT78_01470 [Desulfitobacteriaceae bacterium]|nr:hypothetical protein [Desulfitobacteriaceae bacterium]MDD4751906.1 hypothetical protein [Desulfitobacteriaceae bacterium]
MTNNETRTVGGYLPAIYRQKKATIILLILLKSRLPRELLITWKNAEVIWMSEQRVFLMMRNPVYMLAH